MLAVLKALLWVAFVWTFLAMMAGMMNEGRPGTTHPNANGTVGVSFVVALAALAVIEAVQVAAGEIIATTAPPTPQKAPARPTSKSPVEA